MSALLRYLLSGFAGAFIAMFAEPFFSRLLLIIGVDTSQWAGPVVMLIGDLMQQDWFRLVGAGVIGASVGAWGHWLATRVDRKVRQPEREKSQAPSTQGETWQAALRKRIDITAWEAGALLADEAPSVGGDTSDIYQMEIHDAVVCGKIVTDFTLPGPVMPLTSGALNLALEKFRDEMMKDGRPIAKVEIARFYYKKHDLPAVKRLGHSFREFEVAEHQQPQDKPA